MHDFIVFKHDITILQKHGNGRGVDALTHGLQHIFAACQINRCDIASVTLHTNLGIRSANGTKLCVKSKALLLVGYQSGMQVRNRRPLTIFTYSRSRALEQALFNSKLTFEARPENPAAAVTLFVDLFHQVSKVHTLAFLAVKAVR